MCELIVSAYLLGALTITNCICSTLFLWAPIKLLQSTRCRLVNPVLDLATIPLHSFKRYSSFHTPSFDIPLRCNIWYIVTSSFEPAKSSKARRGCVSLCSWNTCIYFWIVVISLQLYHSYRDHRPYLKEVGRWSFYLYFADRNYCSLSDMGRKTIL